MKTQEHSVVAFVRHTEHRNLQRLTHSQYVKEGIENGKCRIVYGDLLGDISGLTEGCDAVVNFAARTYVDHSLRDPLPFIEANVLGTYRMLEDARRNKVKRFVQISTDEVYGSILEGSYKEDARINPTNPYAASKAGADALAISYAHSFGMWTAITRTENNAGPWQHPQKVFPTFVKAALEGRRLPVYGDGKHRRQWLYVEDHVEAVLMLLKADVEPGQVFHVAGNQELENLELAKRILDVMDSSLKSFPNKGADFESRLEFLDDHNVRPGHDRRYSLCCEKMKVLGWEPKVSLDECIKKTTNWYLDNEWWLS
jgi:dTDP-glucose 4,6-dehydratase